jgi:hypothetical protein
MGYPRPDALKARLRALARKKFRQYGQWLPSTIHPAGWHHVPLGRWLGACGLRLLLPLLRVRVTTDTRVPHSTLRAFGGGRRGENDETERERNGATKGVTHVGASTYSRGFHSACSAGGKRL